MCLLCSWQKIWKYLENIFRKISSHLQKYKIIQSNTNYFPDFIVYLLVDSKVIDTLSQLGDVCAYILFCVRDPKFSFVILNCFCDFPRATKKSSGLLHLCNFQLFFSKILWIYYLHIMPSDFWLLVPEVCKAQKTHTCTQRGVPHGIFTSHIPLNFGLLHGNTGFSLQNWICINVFICILCGYICVFGYYILFLCTCVGLCSLCKDHDPETSHFNEAREVVSLQEPASSSGMFLMA